MRLATRTLFLVLLFSCISSPAAAALDPDFGDQGASATAVGVYDDRIMGMAVLPDGGVVAAGYSANTANRDMAVVRYTPEGRPDPAFNGDGRVVLDIAGDDDEALAVTVDGQGRIVLAGYAFTGMDRDMVLVRLLPDGSLDDSFGVNGVVVRPVGNDDDVFTAVATGRDGTILAAGYTTGTAGRVVLLARFRDNGVPDPDFAGGGLNLTGVGTDADARALAVDPEGRILVAGSYREGDLAGVLLLRFTPEGALDASFGVDGMAEPWSAGVPATGNALVLEEDGGILVAGSSGEGTNTDTLLLRYSAEGLLDVDFGSLGAVLRDVYGEEDANLALAVSQEGGLGVSAGYAFGNGMSDTLVLRYDLAALARGEDDADAVTMLGEPLSLYDDEARAVHLDAQLRALTAGSSEEGGARRFVLARFLDAPAAAPARAAAPEDGEASPPRRGSTASSSGPEGSSRYIETTAPYEITRTGAFSGGWVSPDTGLTFARRGVVFSIAPNPVLKSGETEVDPVKPPDGDTHPPTCPSGTAESYDNETSLHIALLTNEVAVCRYTATSGLPYASMEQMNTSNSTYHETTTHDPEMTKSDVIYIGCQDMAGNVNDRCLEIRVYDLATATAASPARSAETPVRTTTTTTATTTGTTTDTTDTTDGDTITSGDNATPLGSTASEVVKEGYTSDGFGPGVFSSIITGLTPGTHYFLRAYVVTADNHVYYGDTYEFDTADACFVATAAAGSISARPVRLLRELRDRVLLRCGPGRLLVRAYYRVSPPLADLVGAHAPLGLATRLVLAPLVALSWLLLHSGLPGLVACLALAVMAAAALVPRRLGLA